VLIEGWFFGFGLIFGSSLKHFGLFQNLPKNFLKNKIFNFFIIFKEAKDRENALLHRQVQRLKNKIFELEAAQNVTVNKRTQKRGKRYNARKK